MQIDVKLIISQSQTSKSKNLKLVGETGYNSLKLVANGKRWWTLVFKNMLIKSCVISACENIGHDGFQKTLWPMIWQIYHFKQNGQYEITN